MNVRAWFGSFIWVAVFNLFVACVAYFWSISWAILILCLRHILLGIPKIYDVWRIMVVGKEQFSHLPKVSKDWPNKIWNIVTIIGILITIASFIWINEPLRIILDRI